MKKLLLQISVTLISLASTIDNNVYASYFLECKVEAIVLDVLVTNENDILAEVNIYKSENIDGSSNEDCGFKSKHQEIFIVAKKGEQLPDISMGMSLKIKYLYYSAMSENGPLEDTTWTLIRILK